MVCQRRRRSLCLSRATKDRKSQIVLRIPEPGHRVLRMGCRGFLNRQCPPITGGRIVSRRIGSVSLTRKNVKRNLVMRFPRFFVCQRVGSSRLPSGADAAKAWYGESAGYAYGADGSRGSGHFTAMIWKDARYLGCGRAKGNISCNYWPGPRAPSCAVPNMGGCYAAQVPSPARNASACR